MRGNVKSLRARIVGTIFFSLLLLWGVMVFILHGNTVHRITLEVEMRVSNSVESLRKNIELTHSQIREGKGARLSSLLSSYTAGINYYKGALAFRLYDDDGNETARSYLVYGTGGSEREDYFLRLDEALESDGAILDYLRWVVAHRGEYGEFRLAPGGESLPGDSAVAVVTGILGEDKIIRVARLVLRRGGSEEVVIEWTDAFPGEELTTLELPNLTLSSALLPGLSISEGKRQDERVDLKARLARYRAAEAGVERFMSGGKAAPNWSGSGDHGIYEGRSGGMSLARSVIYSSQKLAVRELLPVYLFTLLVVLALGLLLSKELAGRLAQPLEELSRDAAGEGPPSPEDGPIREVNTLAAAVHASRRRAEENLRREQELTRAVAHELKTPLAVLHSHAEALREDIVPSKREHYLSVIMEESDRMAELVCELLDLARLEAGARPLRAEPLRLDRLTEQVFLRLERLAEEKGVTVTLKLEPVELPADRALLERAVSNYATNALRHCTPGGEIRVTLRREGELACLTVENDGDPIPPEALPRLWDTFYRADAARTRGGVGLGLAIVRETAALHHGSCAAENLPGAVAFHLTLPCNLHTAVV